MDCPACNTPLIVVEREGIELDWCLECRGLWFDQGELELLGEKTGHGLETADLGQRPGDRIRRGNRRCPRCRRVMELVQLELRIGDPLQVDRCPAHGIWFDRGELGRLLSRRDASPKTDEGVMLEFLGETLGVAGGDDSRDGRSE